MPIKESWLGNKMRANMSISVLEEKKMNPTFLSTTRLSDEIWDHTQEFEDRFQLGINQEFMSSEILIGIGTR